MKTSLGDDCVAINLDYDAVKEVVQIVSGRPADYESVRLRPSKWNENFLLRNLAGALECNGKSFASVRALYQTDPASARSRRSMWAASLSRARLQIKTGEQRAAIESCPHALQFLEQLSSADPKDTGHRVGMAVTYQIYGDALAAAGRTGDAEYFNQALALCERSLRDDPRNARLRRESADLTEMNRAKSRNSLKNRDFKGKLGSLRSPRQDPARLAVWRFGST